MRHTGIIKIMPNKAKLMATIFILYLDAMNITKGVIITLIIVHLTPIFILPVAI